MQQRLTTSIFAPRRFKGGRPPPKSHLGHHIREQCRSPPRRIKRVGDAAFAAYLFVDIEHCEGDTAARLTKRACTEFADN